jgi:predicted nucleotidyltransferase
LSFAFRLLQRYADAGNLDRIYAEALPTLQTVDFDVELAGAWLLGKDTAATALPQTFAQLKALLSDAHVSEQLVNDMAKALRSSEEAGTYAKQLLDQFTRGFSSQTVD